MQYPITARGGPPDDRTRVLKYGSMFAVFDRCGDVEPWGLAEHGIFFEGTRYLSQFVLHIGGVRPLLLSSTVREDNLLLTADLANVDLIGTDDKDIPRGVLLITRLRFLSQASCFEQLEIRNFGLEPVSTFLDISFSADFADIFEVRGTQRPHRGTMLPGRVRASSVTFGYLGL